MTLFLQTTNPLPTELLWFMLGSVGEFNIIKDGPGRLLTQIKAGPTEHMVSLVVVILKQWLI